MLSTSSTIILFKLSAGGVYDGSEWHLWQLVKHGFSDVRQCVESRLMAKCQSDAVKYRFDCEAHDSEDTPPNIFINVSDAHE